MKLDLMFEGHKVRMVGTAETPEWVARDVCAVLGIRNASGALSVIPWQEKGKLTTHYDGNKTKDLQGIPPQILLTVKEPGLYRLIAKSTKPEARDFQALVFGKVLPSVRRHGCYPPPATQAVVPVPALDLTDIRQLIPIASQLANLVQEMLPKAEAYDRFESASGEFSLSRASRILQRKPRKLMALMEADGILFRGRGETYEPTAEYRDGGYFKVLTTEVNGTVRVQTLVTPRGLHWLGTRYAPTDRSGALDGPGQLALDVVTH